MKDWAVPSSQLLLLGFLKHRYPCNYLNATTSPCSVLHHTIRTDSFMCHIIHRHFLPASMILESCTIYLSHGINYEDLLSSGKWHSLVWQWGIKALQKPVASGHTLEMTTVGSSKTLAANHQTIHQHIPEHSKPFAITFFRTSENYIFIGFFGT